MKLVGGSSALVLWLLAGCSTMPGGASKEAEEHAAHHPPQGATPDARTQAPHDQPMKKMQEMHQKMAAAKTPEDRAALMKDHMKAMQDGMAMMGRMKTPDAKGGGVSNNAEMMGKRMDMMEMMMQMMMDREGMKPPATK